MVEPIFKEDFFQRIVNVNWVSEKPCRFMAGDSGAIINDMVVDGGIIYTSDDGKHWNNVSSGDMAGYLCGLWMRTNFVETGAPIWLMAGQSVHGQNACVAYSRDGSFHTTLVQFTDFRDNVSQPRPSYIRTMDVQLSGGSHPSYAYVFVESGGHRIKKTTTDGINWLSGGSVQTVDAADVSPLSAESGGGTGPKLTAVNNIYQRGNSGGAIGRVKAGPFKGRYLKLTGLGGDINFFTSSIRVSDFKTGEVLSVVNSKVDRGSSICYGHYVFCIGGNTEANGKFADGCIAWSDDAVNWNLELMSRKARIWPVIAGPFE